MAVGINIDEFKRFTEFLAKKSGKGDYATPSQFNLLVNQAIREYIYRRNGNKQQYQVSHPIPPVSYEKTSDVMDDLRYLKEVRTFVANNGVIPIPDGTTVVDMNGAVCPEYIHWKSLRHYYYVQNGSEIVKKQYDIKVVPEVEIGRRLVSEVNPPTKKFAIGQILSTSIQLYPTTVQYVVMDYLRYPVTATWAYTTINGRPVYDSANSVDIELPKEAMNEVAMMYLSFLGINMRDGELVQYAETMKNQGV